MLRKLNPGVLGSHVSQITLDAVLSCSETQAGERITQDLLLTCRDQGGHHERRPAQTRKTRQDVSLILLLGQVTCCTVCLGLSILIYKMGGKGVSLLPKAIIWIKVFMFVGFFLT